MFKVSRGLSPKIVYELFQFSEQIPYELRQRLQFQISWVHLVFSGTESLKLLGPKIWALVPNEKKQLKSLGKFRIAIKQWKPTSRPYRLCKRYIHRIGFFNKKLFLGMATFSFSFLFVRFISLIYMKHHASCYANF